MALDGKCSAPAAGSAGHLSEDRASRCPTGKTAAGVAQCPARWLMLSTRLECRHRLWPRERDAKGSNGQNHAARDNKSRGGMRALGSRPNNMVALVRALEDAGMEFIPPQQDKGLKRGSSKWPGPKCPTLSTARRQPRAHAAHDAGYESGKTWRCARSHFSAGAKIRKGREPNGVKSRTKHLLLHEGDRPVLNLAASPSPCGKATGRGRAGSYTRQCHFMTRLKMKVTAVAELLADAKR